MKKLFCLFVLIGLLSCKNIEEEDSYKIYNEVLKEMVSTYGINLNYIHFPNNYSIKETEARVKKISDSLIKSKSLTFYLDDRQEILDTLNFPKESKISKSKIDLKKITEPKFAMRLDHPQPVNENARYPTYLGNYYLSKPIIISGSNAVIKFEYYGGEKCGYGYLIYLKKIDGQWKIVRKKQIYIT